MKLYELPAMFRDIADRLDAEDGEAGEGILTELAALEMNLQDKARNIIALVRELEVEEDAIRQEVQRLRLRMTAKGNAAKRLREYLKDTMLECGTPRIDVGIAKLSVNKASRPSIKWSGEPDSAPAEFRRMVVELDGGKAYEAWKVGTLPAGFIVEQSTYLMVR